jgi:hypothetical protein
MTRKALSSLSIGPEYGNGPERLLALVIAVVLAVATLTGCGYFQDDPRVNRLFTLFITTSDLPAGWWRVGGGIGDAEGEGVVSRWVQFQGAPEAEFPSVLVWQELSDYPDTERAARAYAEQVTAYFPTEDWVWPEQIEFHSQADQFHFACLAGQIRVFDGLHEKARSHHSCTAIGQYGSIVSILHANVFEDEWLTFDDLQRLLESADARLTSQP